MNHKLNFNNIKSSSPNAFEALINLGTDVEKEVHLKLNDIGKLSFRDYEGFISEKHTWNNRMLFDFFDEYSIFVAIEASFDSKIRFSWEVSFMSTTYEKIIFETGGLWIHRKSAEEEAFVSAFACLEKLIKEGCLTYVVNKIQF